MKHDMKAILGEDFFKEEVRSGYLMTTTTKMMMAMQIDLYLIFAEICERHNLRYFLCFGGLLGAIRHNGFIPWDDDLDVIMPREDYNKFIEIAPSELEEPYSLQTPYTYPNCLYSIITLRNNMGTFTPKIFKNLDYNKGIPLDIFPLDFCDPQTYIEDRKKIYEQIMRCSTYMKKMCHIDTDKQRNDLLIYDTDNPLEAWEKLQELASNPNYKNSEYCGIPVIIESMSKSPYFFKVKNFEYAIPHKFENIEVMIPCGYDEILTSRYGDYMSLPPEGERGLINKSLIIDPFTPYKDFKF